MLSFDPLRRILRLANAGRAIYEDARYFAVDVELDARAARAWLPPGVALARPATATVFAAHFPKTSFGSVYDEAGVFFHVRRRLRSAVFCPWMVVTDDVALVLGRELLGYPKKLAEIDLAIDGDEVRAEVVRRGRRLLSIRGRLGEPMRAGEAPPMLGQRALNVRGALGPGAQRLVTFRPRERAVEVRRASATLEVHAAADGDARGRGRETDGRDPLTELGLGRVLAARLHRVDLLPGLPPREVRRAGLAFAARSLGARFL